MHESSSGQPPDAAVADNSRVERWLQRLRDSRHATPLLGGASFLETLVVPIPIELILLPYMAVRRDRIWWIASVVLLGCLLGALVGYGVGYFLFDQFGERLLEALGWTEAYARFDERFDTWGFWAIVAIGVTPLPFQVAMLMAGATGYALPLFLLAAVLARGVRYYGLAALVWFFGPAAARLWREHRAVAAVLISLVVAAIAALLWWRAQG